MVQVDRLHNFLDMQNSYHKGEKRRPLLPILWGAGVFGLIVVEMRVRVSHVLHVTENE